MKKRRILSFLLAAMLTLSCVPVSAATTGTSATTAAAGFNENAEWTDASGISVVEVDEADNAFGITEYIHVEAGGIKSGDVICGGDGFYYTDTTKALTAGTYRVSFYVRSQDIKNETRNPALRLAVNTKSGSKEIPANNADAANYPDCYYFTRANGNTNWKAAEITEEWTYKSYDIALDAADKLQFRIWTFWDAEDGVSFDIAKLSFVNLATGEELIGNGTLKKQDGNQISVPEWQDAISYFRTGDAASVIKNDTIGVGKYTVTGYFRLSEIDMTSATRSNDITVSALLNGNVKASDTMTLTNTWQKLSIDLDLKAGADQIKLTIPESVDFYGIQYILKEAYSDVWHGANEDDVVSIVNEANNEAGITEYVQVSNTDTHNGAGATFVCNSPLSSAKQYKLSVWMRTIPQINIDANARVDNYRDDGDLDVRIFINNAFNNGGKAQRLEISNIAYAGPHSKNFYVGNGGTRAANVTSEWQEYTIVFTPQLDTTALSICFTRHYNGVDDIVPFDIAKLSVTEVETGTELVTDGTWTGYSNGIVNEMPALEYFKSGNISYISADASDLMANTTLEPGKYVLSGSFQVTEFDHSKVTINFDGILPNGTTDGAKTNTVGEDNNVIAVPVSIIANGSVLATDEITVKGSWSECEAVFDIRKPVTISEIKLDLPTSINFYDIKLNQEEAYEYIDEWTSNDGNVISVVDEGDNEYGITEYIHVDGDYGSVDGGEGFWYKDNAKAVPAGNYTLSFYVRSRKLVNMTRNPALRIYIDGKEIAKGYPDSYEFFNAATGNLTTRAAKITDEWEFKSYNITLEAADKLQFRIWTFWYAEDSAPFDIAKLSLVNNETNEEFIGNGVLSKHETVVPTIETAGTYFSASAPKNGENTAIYNAQPDVILEPGIYKLSGIFRLGDYDFAGSNQVKLSAYAGDTELTANGGNITSDWTDVSFTLDIAVEISMADLKLVLDGCRPLEFKDISLELIERHVSLADVNPGFIITLLALRKYQAENYTKMDVINEVLDAENGTIGEASENDYIHVSEIANDASGAKYVDDTTGFEKGKTYLLTVWMRTMPQVNIDANEDMTSSGDDDMDVRIFIDGVLNNGARMEATNVAHATPISSNIYVGNSGTRGASLTDKWQKYTILFTAQHDTEKISISFQRHWTGGEDVVPFDIDALSVVEVDSATKKPITGENRIKGGNENWSGYNGSEAAELSFETETEYYRATKGLGMENVITDKQTLAAGVYTFSAKIRLAEFDHAKIKLNESDIFANSNAMNVSGFVGDERIYTETGKKNVKITNEWTDVAFTFELTSETKVGKLKFVLDEKLNADFKDIAITEGGRVAPESEREVDKPVDPNRPKPLPAITEGNLIEGALEKDHLAYWIIGDQKLTAKTDSKGVKSFVASNITSKSFGFTYEPGYEIQPGSYHFTGEFRTVNEGETTYARVEIGGVHASRKLNNNWRTIDLYFEVTEPTQISVKLRGGPVLTNVKDYEFRNISLTDVNHQEMSVNLYPAGDFESKESVGEWRFGYGSGLIQQVSEGGNKFMRVSKRSSSDVPIRLEKSIKLLQGETYIISYDIRTSKQGETMRVRSFLGTNIGLTTPYATDNAKILYTITDEWLHVEHTYEVTGATTSLVFDIKGGPGDEIDQKDFDVDNVSIVRLDPADIVDPVTLLPTDPSAYNTGNFDDEATAMTNIGIGYGEGKVTWHKDENGNGYLTVSDKNDSYIPLRLTPGFALTEGQKYKISYDIRASVAGESFDVRAFVSKDGTNGLTVANPVDKSGVLYTITNEWIHIESTFTAPKLMEFFLEIKGGPRGEPDNKAFDIDNLKIEIVN
ncbi:MAG: carbohydrate binding domain-containing protein [Clostridia bacterium]|nr:carbohydrate binding domain-containing protein [Clostridia bacterium]